MAADEAANKAIIQEITFMVSFCHLKLYPIMYPKWNFNSLGTRLNYTLQLIIYSASVEWKGQNLHMFGAQLCLSGHKLAHKNTGAAENLTWQKLGI